MNHKHFFIRRNPRHESGQVIYLIAVMFLALLALVGLATDVVILYKTKQELQRAVDATAVAASRQLPNQNLARTAAYEVLRVYGYDYDPNTNPIQITFPVYSPPRKAIFLSVTDVATFAFLRLFGWNSATVQAQAEAETAPLDIYMVVDLSQSMVYDTPKPACWSYTTNHCRPSGCALNSWSDSGCVARYCNAHRNCDPLDIHIKPAANFFLDQLNSNYDRVGVVSYEWDGRTEINLSSVFTAVRNAINNMDAYEPAGKSTNTGDGLYFAHQNIAAQGRLDAIWSMILLTDGRANVYRSCSGCPPVCTCTNLVSCNECAAANNYALNNAADIWTRHETVIYTIAYGEIFVTDPDYEDLMRDIADRTDNGVINGTTQNFFVAPNATGLRVALAEIAERLYSRLLR